LVPAVATIAVLVNPFVPNVGQQEVPDAARSIGQQVEVLYARNEQEIDAAFTGRPCPAGSGAISTRPDNPAAERKDQTPDDRPTPLAAPTASRVNVINQRSQSLSYCHCSLSQKL